MKSALFVAIAILLLVPAAGAGEGDHAAAPAVNDPRFDFLKQLEGTWVSPASDGGHPPGIFEFRLTAGGTAIEEREFVGTPMEMLTVYHMQGKELVATHYCMLGNQPRMVAAKRVKKNTLSFDCTGTPGNAASHDEEHVHGWAIKLADDGRLHYSAELVKAGEVTETPNVVLTRTTKTASR